MPSPERDEVTQLLRLAREGSRDAVDRILPVLYDELRRLARGQLRQERSDHTLQATALVHEAYLRLVRQDEVGFRDRAQFFGAAAQVMRRILVDHARTKGRAKRGGGAAHRPLDAVAAELADRAIDLVALDDALTALAELDPRKARLVELRFFGGLSVEEAGRMLDLSHRTAERSWTMARAWLRSRLDDDVDAETPA